MIKLGKTQGRGLCITRVSLSVQYFSHPCIYRLMMWSINNWFVKHKSWTVSTVPAHLTIPTHLSDVTEMGQMGHRLISKSLGLSSLLNCFVQTNASENAGSTLRFIGERNLKFVDPPFGGHLLIWTHHHTNIIKT